MKTYPLSRLTVISLVLLACLICSPARLHGGRMSNEHYIIPKDTLNAGGASGTSAHYRHHGTLGQAMPAAPSEPAMHLHFGGFWGGGAMYTLSATTAGSGGGRVIGPGLDCGSDCVQEYLGNTSVVLQAIPDACSELTRWLIDGQETAGAITVNHDIVVTAEFHSTCPSATLAFYEGLDAATRTVVRDPTILPLAPGAVEMTDAILLPDDIADPFDFPAPVHFHLEYQRTGDSLALFVPESTVPCARLDKPYSEVSAADIAGLAPWSAGRPLTRGQTVILQTADGAHIKIGNLQVDPAAWTVFVNIEALD